MGITVETGAGVADANCYGVADAAATRTAARAFASNRGITLPGDDPSLDVLLVKATDYIEIFRDSFVGDLNNVDQALSWPRKNVLKTDGSKFPTDALPQALLFAMYQLCIEQKNGVDLIPSTDGSFVTFEKVDVIETRFSEKVGGSQRPTMPLVEGYLKTIRIAGSNLLPAVRV